MRNEKPRPPTLIMDCMNTSTRSSKFLTNYWKELNDPMKRYQFHLSQKYLYSVTTYKETSDPGDHFEDTARLPVTISTPRYSCR
jgi:hypothetical protein